jgi:omega-amidase
MNNLKVTAIQTNLAWEDKETNLEHFSQLIRKIDKTDVIVLPEMFSTGFTMNVSNMSEEMDGPIITWMKEKAVLKDAALTTSLIVKEGSVFYNRLVWVQPDGTVQFYNKRHLFFVSHEQLHFAKGNSKLVVDWRGWRICPMVCYDLRFPVWIRNLENYDLLIFLANWPSSRHHVWKNLLISRAVENQSFCVGVNRIGSDGMGLKYLGDSGMIDSKGFASFLGNPQVVETFTLSWDELHEFRRKFPVLNDMDSFELT